MDARVRVPVVLGHEMSGRITAVGAEVSRWRVGDPVTVMPLRWCGSWWSSRTRTAGCSPRSWEWQCWTRVAVGIHPMPQMVDMQRVFLRELSLLGARVYERSDFERAVRLIAEGTVPAGRLVSRVEPLGSAAEAFTALESGDGVMKVLADCRGDGGR